MHNILCEYVLKKDMMLCRAADWKEQVWDGRLQVVQKGDKCAVKLIGRDGMYEYIFANNYENPMKQVRRENASFYVLWICR